MKKVNVEDYQYQLTEWENTEEGLSFAMSNFVKYKKPFVIRVNEWRQLAIFTEGLYMTGEWYEFLKKKFQTEATKHPAIYSYDGLKGTTIANI